MNGLYRRGPSDVDRQCRLIDVLDPWRSSVVLHVDVTAGSSR